MSHQVLAGAATACLIAVWWLTTRMSMHALRGAVTTHLMLVRMVEGDDQGWVETASICAVFGSTVYAMLRELVERGVLEQREGPTSADRLQVRGGRHVVFYRWRA